MGIDESNQQQADFWASAGPMWVERRDHFDRHAGAHGVAALDALAPADGEQIIDVGCGAGSTTIELGRRVGPAGSVTGLDISEPMVAGAQELAESVGATNVSFVVADAMNADLDGDRDGVYSRFGVMFFSDATAGFANLRTALRPGGRIAFTCWRSPAENPWISESFARIQQYVELPFGQDPTAPGPMSLADPDRVRSVLSGAGFDSIEVTPFDAPARLGGDADDAVDFLSDLMPMIDALRNDDPDAANRLRDELVEMVAAWTSADGVLAPSATWIVTAVNA